MTRDVCHIDCKIVRLYQAVMLQKALRVQHLEVEKWKLVGWRTAYYVITGNLDGASPLDACSIVRVTPGLACLDNQSCPNQ